MTLPAAAKEPPIIGDRPSSPRIKVDRVTLPAGIEDRRELERRLIQSLKREGRRADWGTGSDSTIVFRYTVDELTVKAKGKALEIHCSAHGELPRGRIARGKLDFGGDPRRKKELVWRVLEIVARGVVARLASLERQRRGR